MPRVEIIKILEAADFFLLSRAYLGKKEMKTYKHITYGENKKASVEAFINSSSPTLRGHIWRRHKPRLWL